MGCLESFIINYGYLAILIGSMVEGEIILVLGGLAAYSGYLSLPWVIGIAFFGTFVADQIYFFLGRWHSPRILAARPSWKLRMNKAERLFRRFRTPLILIFRFLYGIRAVLVFVIGMSSINPMEPIGNVLHFICHAVRKRQDLHYSQRQYGASSIIYPTLPLALESPVS